VRAFGAARRHDLVAQHTRRTEEPAEARVHVLHLGDLVHRRQVDLLLRVEAGAQRPLVLQREQTARLDEAQRLGVRQQIQRLFERHAELEQPVLRRPRLGNRAFVDSERARILPQQPRRHTSGAAVSANVMSGREAGTMRWR
jgi:hypothetical protein